MPFSLQPSVGGSGIRACDSKKLNDLIRRAGSTLGTAIVSLEVVMERRMVQVNKSVFSGRLRQLSCRKERFKNTLLTY